MNALREKLTPPPPWRIPLFFLTSLLSGFVLAVGLRLIDCQSLRYTLAVLAKLKFWYTALFLGLVCAGLGFLTHSLFAGCLLTFLPMYLLVLVNYFKVLITSVPLSLGDFTLIGQAGDIAALNTKAITFGRNTILAILGGILWLALAWFFSKPLRVQWGKSLFGAAGSAAALFLVFWISAGPLVYSPLGAPLSEAMTQSRVNYVCGGPVLGLWRSLHQTASRRPGGEYSPEQMEAVVNEAADYAAGQDKTPGQGHPNLILILSESFFDITELPGVNYEQDPVAGFHALQKEGVSGAFYTRSLGYGTCNIELEILTGLNSGLLNGEDLYSWNPAVFSRLPTVVSLLRDAGYSTDFLHMFNDEIYHRANIFSRLGFDNLYFSDALGEFYSPAAQAPDYWAYLETRIEGQFYSDELMTDALIALYEKRSEESDAPALLYGVSMENHSTYTDKYAPEELTVEPRSDLTGEAAEQLLNLSQGVSNASAALAKLADYFRDVEEPTVIVFYGDHRPGLGLEGGGSVYSALGMVPADHAEWTTEQIAELYSTDYLIWANDPALLPGEPGSTRENSCNYLGATLLDLAGAEQPLYWQLISQLSEIRLCDTVEYHLGRDGALSDRIPQEGPDGQGLELLRQLLNDAVYGEQYVTEEIGKTAHSTE